MSLRPEGYKNPFDPAAVTVRGGNDGKPISHHQAFEYGADEMLKALCTDENKLDCIDEREDKKGSITTEHRKGWLVFIPDVE